MAKTTRRSSRRQAEEAEVIERSQFSVKLDGGRHDFGPGGIYYAKASGIAIVTGLLWPGRILFYGKGRVGPALWNGCSGGDIIPVERTTFAVICPWETEVGDPRHTPAAVFIDSQDDVQIEADMQEGDSLSFQDDPGLSFRVTFLRHDNKEAQFELAKIAGDLPSLAKMKLIVSGDRAF